MTWIDDMPASARAELADAGRIGASRFDGPSTNLDRATLDRMTAYRDEGRRELADKYGEPLTGGCSWTSEWIEDQLGYQQAGGCYRPIDGEKHTGQHVAHLWNVLPDGRILDATADQFDGAPGVRIAPADDSRYLPDCDGESCNDGEGAR